MRSGAVLLALGVLLGVAATSPVLGQVPREVTPILYEFEMDIPQTVVDVERIPGEADVVLTIRDRSRDSTNIVPGAPGTPVRPHSITFELSGADGEKVGWNARPIVPIANSIGGRSYQRTLTVSVSPQAEDAYFLLNVTGVAQTDGGEIRFGGAVLFRSPGLPGLTVNVVGRPDELAPREVSSAAIQITNNALIKRTVSAEVVRNACNVRVVPPAGLTLEPGEQRVVEFSVQAPEDRFWYYSANCDVMLEVYATDQPTKRYSAPVSVVVNGFYIDPMFVFWVLVLALSVTLLVLLVKRGRERRDEAILGKPQKPWTIPVEKVYLEHLRSKDARAYHVVRHYLMEDEYKSSMLWYRSFKAATKGNRKKERIVVAHEAAYERWRARWQARIAQPPLLAARFEERMIQRLGRKARKRLREDQRAHRKLVSKMKAAHAKRLQRATQKWQKKATRAERKGRPAPARPELPEPEYPSAPKMRQPVLAETREGRRVARVRAAMVRRQGDLEVRFEKADARRLQRVRRKAQRAARKLDDPAFVKEHPLLQ